MPAANRPAEATPGPWSCQPAAPGDDHHYINSFDGRIAVTSRTQGAAQPANAALIVQAVNERASLLAQADAARGLVAQMQDYLERIYQCMGGDAHNGWDAPEDVWGLASEALEALAAYAAAAPGGAE